MRRHRRSVLVLWVLLVLVPAAAAAGPAHAHATGSADCGQHWGSQPKWGDGRSTAQVADLRAGRHRCFDRLVLDVEGPLGPWSVRYVDRIYRDGSAGREVPLRGGGRLEIAVYQPPVPSDGWFLPNGELCDTSGFRTFRHVAWAGDSRGGRTLIGLGVRARLPVRAFPLDGPGAGSRLVIDVAHRW